MPANWASLPPPCARGCTSRSRNCVYRGTSRAEAGHPDQGGHKTSDEGELKIEADIAPKTLVDRLIVVHNLGRIEGSAEQIAALEFHLGINEGHLKAVSTEKESEEPEPEQPRDEAEYAIDNIVHIKL